jgi:hypothetical protein
MDLNRKGMAAMVDAVIFLAVLSIVAGVLFTGTPPAEDQGCPYAEETCHTLMSVKLSLCDVHDTEDTDVVTLPDLVSGYIRTGKGSIMDYVSDALDAMVPVGYLMTFGLNGKDASVGDGGESLTSAFTGSITVIGGETMEFRLEIY